MLPAPFHASFFAALYTFFLLAAYLPITRSASAAAWIASSVTGFFAAAATLADAPPPPPAASNYDIPIEAIEPRRDDVMTQAELDALSEEILGGDPFDDPFDD